MDNWDYEIYEWDEDFEHYLIKSKIKTHNSLAAVTKFCEIEAHNYKTKTDEIRFYVRSQEKDYYYEVKFRDVNFEIEEVLNTCKSCECIVHEPYKKYCDNCNIYTE